MLHDFPYIDFVDNQYQLLALQMLMLFPPLILPLHIQDFQTCLPLVCSICFHVLWHVPPHARVWPCMHIHFQICSFQVMLFCHDLNCKMPRPHLPKNQHSCFLVRCLFSVKVLLCLTRMFFPHILECHLSARH